MAQRWQQKLWMKTCGTLCEPVNLDGFPYFSFLVGMKCRFSFILTAKYGTDCRAAPVCPHFWALVVNKMEMMWQGIFAILRANPNGLCERVEANSTWACWEHICCRLNAWAFLSWERLSTCWEPLKWALLLLSWWGSIWCRSCHEQQGNGSGTSTGSWVGHPSQILDMSVHGSHWWDVHQSCGWDAHPRFLTSQPIVLVKRKWKVPKEQKNHLEIKSREEVGLIWRPKGRVDAPGFQWHAAVRGEENIFSCCLHVNGFMNIQNKWTFGKRDF